MHWPEDKKEHAMYCIMRLICDIGVKPKRIVINHELNSFLSSTWTLWGNRVRSYVSGLTDECTQMYGIPVSIESGSLYRFEY